MKAYVDTSQGQIHYRFNNTSSNLPHLVMIHQTTSTSRMFEPVIEQLDKHYRMIALDFPGYGGSFLPEDVPCISYYADVLLEALSNLGVDNFNIIGHHTGGGIALDMADRFPERILSLSIVGPIYASAEERTELRKITTQKANELVPKRDGSHLLSGWKMLETYGAAQLPLELHHLEAMDHLTAWKACAQAYEAIIQQDFSSLFDRVKSPLLIICSRDDVLWPYFRKAQAARPDAESAIVQGPDYQCTVDPDGVANALHAFIQKQTS